MQKLFIFVIMQSKQENIEIYLLNPSICKWCKNPILNYSKRQNNFCSRSCSNSFTNTNSNKSIETRDKISKSISSKEYNLKCSKCDLHYIAKSLRRNLCDICKKLKKREYFSAQNTRLNKNYFRDLLKAKGEYVEKRGGLRERGGKVKNYFTIKDSSGKEAFLNKDELSLVNYLNENHIIWNRNLNGFKYIDFDEKIKKFYPDFYLPEYNLFIEYKGFVTDKMIHKMNDCKQRNKINLLIVYSRKFSNLGIQIDDIVNYLQASVV